MKAKNKTKGINISAKSTYLKVMKAEHNPPRRLSRTNNTNQKSIQKIH